MEHLHDIHVRKPEPADIAGMARVHVSSWQETYRGMMPDTVLDDPQFIERRERFWTAALIDPRYAENRAALAESAGEVVGVAMAGKPEDQNNEFDSQLYLIYLLKRVQGSGAGQALLEAVLRPEDSVVLWVADPNPLAQSFYCRNGFKADGISKDEDGVREIRMVRPPDATH